MSEHRLVTTDFSHVSDMTAYMRRVIEIIDELGDALRVLDVPAGNGLMVDELRRRGHEAVGADINEERKDFVYADMSGELPFEDGRFDAATCLEGIEHVVDENLLLSELLRVLRPGGTLVISTPNVMNLYSRWHALLRGYPYMFAPAESRHIEPGRLIDRGHVNPLSYLRLRYLLEHHGADVVALAGDRIKKAWMLPLLLPLSWLGRLMSRGDFLPDGDDAARQRAIRRDLRSSALLLRRSLIVVARKRSEAQPSPSETTPPSS